MTDRRITWLHLSDFHVGMDSYAQRKLFAEILAHVGERISAPGFTVDFVFVTGDIANRGQQAEYEEFWTAFYIPLIDMLGNAWDGKLFAVPGNHDIDRAVAQFFSREEILKAGTSFFDPTSAGKQLRAQLTPRFSSYSQWMTASAPEDWLQSDNGAFDLLLDVRGTATAIIGINTAWLSKDDLDRHQLTPGTNILEDALARHSGADVKIVLGHHPLDWLDDGQARQVRTILARHNAIYLAGHLHEDGARYEDGGIGTFLALQSGAAFQGRAEDQPRLINGLQWGQLYVDRRELLLQAYHWSAQHREWKLTTEAFANERRSAIPDWWSFPLPTPKPTKEAEAATRLVPVEEPLRPPAGWMLVDPSFLAPRLGHDSRDKMLQYFDGRPPDWSLALSNAVPQRKIVAELRHRFLSVGEQAKPNVVTLLGAGGEGKSTAFLQTVASLVRDGNWTALWRHDEDALLAPQFLDLCSSKLGRLLVAVDDAHSFAVAIPALLLALKRSSRRNVHFLLCSRTIDWRAEAQSGGYLAHIVAASDYQELRLAGLGRDDAAQLVDAWSRLGKEGLSELYSLPREEAIEQLRTLASDTGSGDDEGVLLGAMLRLRYGNKLKDKIRSILYRLRELESPGAPLIDAFAMIAAMHAEGLRFLSKPVLGAALGLSPTQLRTKVLNTLSDEAVVAGGGRFVLARHREIARASIALLEETNLFGDIDEIFPTLARAALVARGRGEYVPELHKWDYDLPRHFVETDRTALALACAEMLQRTDPTDIRLRVNLSKTYRDTGVFSKAANIFRDYEGEITTRAAWTEWAVAEVSISNVIAAALLAAAALCDLPQHYPPSTRDGRALVALAYNFLRVYEQYPDDRYRDTAMAATQIGLRAINEEEIRNRLSELQASAQAVGATIIPERDLANALRLGVGAAFEVADEVADFDKLVKARVSKSRVLSFDGLMALAKLRQRA